MKFVLLIISICIVPFFTIAQNKQSLNLANNTETLKLNRKAFAVVGLELNHSLDKEISKNFNTIKLPDNYLKIAIDSTTITPVLSDSYFSDIEETRENELIQLLNQKKIAHQLLNNWFNLQVDSSFNLDILKERGSINYTDDDFKKVSETRNGRLKLMEMGLKLVNQTYVLVFDFRNTQTMAEYYNKNGTKEVNKILNGYISTVNCNLLKLDFNSSVATSFFRDYWIAKNDSNKTEQFEHYENASFPFILVKSYSYKLTSAQHNPEQALAPKKQKSKEELLKNLAELSIEKVFSDINTQQEPINLRLMIREAEPISAKIGRKSGLKFDQRYFVYENRIRKDGTIQQKRIGVVKSNRVADNRKDSIPQTVNSTFYQISGGPINNGMFLKKRDDLGLNLFLGNSFGSFPGYTGRIEYYLSKMFDDMVSPEKGGGQGSTSIKIYLSSTYHQQLYTIDNHIWNNTFVRGSLGVSKDFYPFRLLHWGPYLGYGMESITREGTLNKISSNFVEMGLNFGLNVMYNVQLIASYNYYKFFNSVELDEQKDVANPNFNYHEVYTDRKKHGGSLGVRMMF